MARIPLPDLGNGSKIQNQVWNLSNFIGGCATFASLPKERLELLQFLQLFMQCQPNANHLLSTYCYVDTHISLCELSKCRPRRHFNVIRNSKTSVAAQHRKIYLPKVNVTSIWHLAGGITGPGWQEMNAALHHNEFMDRGQVALCMCKRNHNEKNPSDC